MSFAFQVSCLALCVASVWMPGSPFDPDALFGASPDNSSIDSFEIESNETSEATTVSTEEDTSSLMVSIVLFVSAIVVSRIGKEK